MSQLSHFVNVIISKLQDESFCSHVEVFLRVVMTKNYIFKKIFLTALLGTKYIENNTWVRGNTIFISSVEHLGLGGFA